ncbi:MAG: hypothetical protein H6829_09610 [Planctomycetes bacterium]|nr:hypothetical protein [Planctomycetota bacterium]MCB9912632.1 hypothetical protein [Planctomycetota bacterium]HPF15332.1 hypothetical protein [Planctomycetota bacterium]
MTITGKSGGSVSLTFDKDDIAKLATAVIEVVDMEVMSKALGRADAFASAVAVGFAKAMKDERLAALVGRAFIDALDKQRDEE